MTFSGDPFRTLGLPAGASEADIKRAYRALAKRYHPDSAGETALPRFLAIQAAYDMLTTPEGRTRARTTRGSAPAPGTARPASGGTRGARPAGAGESASSAESDRARATRDAFRARRSRPAASGSTGPTGGPAWWAAGRNGNASGRADSTAGTEAGSGANPGGAAGGPTADTNGRRGGEAGRGRRPKVATFGSTSYDDAPRDPEPEWNGATWYGDHSGTYWTINPKEYADPRKHGPEYLARARRGSGGAASSATDAAAGPDAEIRQSAGPVYDREDAGAAAGAGTDGLGAAGAAPNAASHPPAGEPGRPFGAPRAAEQRAGAAGAPTPNSAAGPRNPAEAWRSRNDARRERTTAWTTTAAPSANRTSATGTASRVAFDHGMDDDVDIMARPFDAALPQRILLALIAWPPLGLGAAAFVGEATGCSRYSAACTEPLSMVGWLVQPAIVAVLLLLPVLARLGAIASVTVGVAAIGGVGVLTALGGARVQTTAAPTLLLAILVMAYAVGLVGALSGRIPLPGWLRPPD